MKKEKLNKRGKIELTKILMRTYGKCQFSEEELHSKEFWDILFINGNEYFKNGGEYFNYDFFWSEAVSSFLREDKTKWMKEAGFK